MAAEQRYNSYGMAGPCAVGDGRILKGASGREDGGEIFDAEGEVIQHVAVAFVLIDYDAVGVESGERKATRR